jgi:hypothetical protein
MHHRKAEMPIYLRRAGHVVNVEIVEELPDIVDMNER